MDFNSPQWHVLKKWTEDQLKKAREKNDLISLNEVETAALRGEIRVLKRILDLPNEVTRSVEVFPDT
jgi:hypothetical protein